ncbi:MAG: oligosaccharide flippase family protein [Thermoanaerobaculia bacterium]
MRPTGWFGRWLSWCLEGLGMPLRLVPRLASGAFWSVGGGTLLQGMQLVTSVILARILGTGAFGLFGILQTTISAFAVLAAPALGAAGSRYVSALRRSDPIRAGRIAAMTLVTSGLAGIAGAVFLVLEGDRIAEVFGAAALGGPLRIGAIAVACATVNGAQVGILSGLESFRRLALLNGARGLLTVTLVPLCAQFWNVTGVAWCLGGIGVATVVLTEYALRAESLRAGLEVSKREWWREKAVLGAFAFPAFLGGFLVLPVLWLATAWLARSPNGLAEVGLFTAANHWRLLVLFLPGVLMQPLLPVLSSAWAAGSVGEFRMSVRSQLRLVLGVTGAAAAAISILAAPIMSAYGRDFSRGSVVLVWLVWSAVLSALAGVIGVALAAMNRMWTGLWLNAGWAVVFLGLARIFRADGAAGLAAAFAASYTLHLLVTMMIAGRELSKSRMET